jgi:ribose transport system substrate-binding protein
MDKPTFLVSLMTQENDYQVEQAASAQAAAAKLGVNLQIVYANNDAVLQTQQILKFVQEPSERPDAILVEPVGTGMPQVAKAAVSAGVAWAIVNAGVDYLPELRRDAMVPVFSVVSNNEEIGKIQGQQIGALLGQSGCVLAIEGPSVRDVARLRTKGMMAAKPARVTVKALKGDWTQNSGYHAIRQWLGLSTSRELHVGLIACQNDDMAIGARRAFEELADTKEREAWLKLPILGCDGVPKTGQAWVRSRRMTATVISPPLMGDAMHLLVAARKSGVQPPERTVASPVSFPTLADLKRAHAASAAGQTS